MNIYTMKTLGASIVIIALSGLAACGGGGGDGLSSTAPGSPSAPSVLGDLTLSGTVATGLAIAGASINAKCKAGTGSATTIADGTYIMVVTGGQLPCVLQVTNPLDGSKSHTVATGSGTALTANITPLTEMLTARVLGKEPAVFFAAFDVKAATNTITTATVKAAQTDVGTVLNGYVDTSALSDFISTPLKAATASNLTGGDAQDKLLDALKVKLSGAQVAQVVSSLAGTASTAEISQVVSALATAPSFIELAHVTTSNLSGRVLSYRQDLPPVASNFKASAGRFTTPVASASWPIKIAPSISSPFSPRQKASESGRYDWHRGIDIPGVLGEPVYSIADGKVEKIVLEGEPQALEGGNTVYIAHSIDPAISFQGRPVSRFYSVHVHLQTIDPATVVGASVAKGQQIGTLGQSGTTTFNHDHFEIRMQTTCSLEFQLQNPASACAQYNFDPHVNPVQFLFPDDKTAPELVGISLSGTTLSASVKTGAPISDFDYIALVLKDVQGNIVYSREIGFNAREGFDASSTATLDIDKRNGVIFAPAGFHTGAVSYGITFSYDLSGLAVVPDSGGLLIQDVWGNTRTFSLSFN